MPEEKAVALKESKPLTISDQAIQIAKFKKELTPEQKETLKSTVAKNATDDELALFMAVATQRGLNPFNRQIYFIKRKSKGEDGEWEDAPTIQTGIDGLRSIADNTETYAPSPKSTIFQYTPNGQLLSATAFVMKYHRPSNQWVEFSATAFYSEYVQKTKAGNITRFWREMPRGQLEKCAEAKALRKGWPEKLGGLYTFDEMAQADNPATVVDADYKVLEGGTPTPLDSLVSPIGGNPIVDAAKQAGAIILPNIPKLNKKYPNLSLETCGEHGDTWIPGEYGKYHKMPKGNCYLRNVVRDITMVLVPKYLGFNSHEEPKKRGDKMVRYLTDEFKGWLKKDREIDDWNKTDIEKQLETLESLIEE